jgi:hypothetical protein
MESTPVHPDLESTQEHEDPKTLLLMWDVKSGPVVALYTFCELRQILALSQGF